MAKHTEHQKREQDERHEEEKAFYSVPPDMTAKPKEPSPQKPPPKRIKAVDIDKAADPARRAAKAAARAAKDKANAEAAQL